MALEDYHHEALPNPRDYIRLVEIHPAEKNEHLTITIKAFQRALTPPYTALSYTWGNKELSKGIVANGKLLNVTENCWYALGQLRLHALCNYYWIDAICINQADDAEKSAQVNLMGKTYRNVELGAIAIGRHDRASKHLFSKLEEVLITRENYDAVEHLDHLDQECLERLSHDLAVLGMRPYWHRLWIVQEFALPRKVILLCGNSFIDFGAILSLKNALRGMAQGRSRKFSTRYDDNMLEMTPMASTVRLRQTIRNSQAGGTEFSNVIDLIGVRECIDARDRIFGVLSLVKWEEAEEPLSADYSLSKADLIDQALDHYKGDQLEVTGQLLRMLEVAANDPGMWAIWQHGTHRQNEAIPLRDPQPRRVRRAKLHSTMQVFRVRERTRLHPISEHWSCIMDSLRNAPSEYRALDIDGWLAAHPVLLPAATRIGDIIIEFERVILVPSEHRAHDYYNGSVLVLRPMQFSETLYSIVGHVLNFPRKCESSLSSNHFDVTEEMGFELNIDGADLLFWMWQQMHWGQKRCATLAECDEVMKVFSVGFCHGQFMSYARAWQSPYAQHLSELGMDKLLSTLPRAEQRLFETPA